MDTHAFLDEKLRAAVEEGGNTSVLDTGEDIAVVIGGGTGCPLIIDALKEEGSLLPASITGMHDDGGRSKVLRDVHGTLPPGDFIRAVLAHLKTTEEVDHRLREFLSTPYPKDKSPFAGYTGAHVAFAFCEKLWGRTGAVNIFPRLWGDIRGWPYPATINDVHLAVDLSDGRTVFGEGNVDLRSPHDEAYITRARLEPSDGVVAYPPALQAIKHPKTGVICLAMGDFYSSRIGTMLVPLLADAIRAAKHAKLVVWTNLMEKKAETPGWDAATFIEKLLEYDIGRDKVDVNFVSVGPIPRRLSDSYWKKDLSKPVVFNKAVEKRMQTLCGEVICNDYVDREGLKKGLIRHDPRKVAEDLVAYHRRTCAKPAA